MTQQSANHGTAFSDGVRIGSFRSGQYNFGAPGISLSSFYDYAIVPTARYDFFTGVIAGAGALNIQRPLHSNITFQGYSNVVQLDTCRGLRVHMTNTSGGAITLTISGWDIHNHKLVQTISVPDGNIVYSTKSFAYIKSVYSSGACAGITIGVANTFGLPFFCPNGSYLTSMFAGHPDYSLIVIGNGVTYLQYVPFLTSTGIGLLPGDFTTPTATSSDPRGLFGVSSTVSGGEGVRFIQYVPGFETQAGTVLAPDIAAPSQANTYGLTQYSTGWQ